MDSILIPWNDGNGNIVISNNGGDVLISSDVVNESVERTQVLTFRTTDGTVSANLTVTQKGKRVILRDNSGAILRDNTEKVLTSKT